MSTEDKNSQEEIVVSLINAECPICEDGMLYQCSQRQWYGERETYSFQKVWFACDTCEATFNRDEVFPQTEE